MIGLIALVILIFWVWFAIWAASKLSQYFWRKSDSQLITTIGSVLTTVMLTVLMFLMPFWDQLIAYPKWQQLCSTTGDFEWGLGMNEKKAFGRELVVFGDTHETTIFPNIHVTYFSSQFKDAKTDELVLNMPHYSYYKARAMFYVPSGSGDNSAIFLSECSKDLNGKTVADYLKQFNLKVIEYK